jgi:RNA polymerase sigma factor (sigma-70 family)
MVMSRDDQTRFSNLVLPHLSDCYALARWLTGNGTDAEDVVQEACLRAFRAIDGYAGGNARAWILTIVRNTAYTWLRNNRPAELVMVDDLEAAANDNAAAMEADRLHGMTPEASIIAKADAARLKEAIAGLPAEFRETLVLREVHGLDYREIAAVTGKPVGTVMSRLARARRRLMSELGTEKS